MPAVLQTLLTALPCRQNMPVDSNMIQTSRRLDTPRTEGLVEALCKELAENKFSSLMHLLPFKAKLTRRPDLTRPVEGTYKIWPLQNFGYKKEGILWVLCCFPPNNFERSGLADVAQSNYILKLGWAPDRYVVYSLK